MTILRSLKIVVLLVCLACFPIVGFWMGGRYFESVNDVKVMRSQGRFANSILRYRSIMRSMGFSRQPSINLKPVGQSIAGAFCSYPTPTESTKRAIQITISPRSGTAQTICRFWVKCRALAISGWLVMVKLPTTSPSAMATNGLRESP